MRFLLCIVVLIAPLGCDGVLREKVGSVDASVLTTIPTPPCTEAMTPADTGACTGGGEPGDDCLACHHQNGAGAPFTFAGTLYDDQQGTTPIGGATVFLQDALGNMSTAITHPGNGNFYLVDGGYIEYPAKAFVALCPTVIEMIAPVDEVNGANCNTSGCHTRGFRVHL